MRISAQKTSNLFFSQFVDFSNQSQDFGGVFVRLLHEYLA